MAFDIIERWKASAPLPFPAPVSRCPGVFPPGKFFEIYMAAGEI